MDVVSQRRMGYGRGRCVRGQADFDGSNEPSRWRSVLIPVLIYVHGVCNFPRPANTVSTDRGVKYWLGWNHWIPLALGLAAFNSVILQKSGAYIDPV
jgi:hypothetical protein